VRDNSNGRADLIEIKADKLTPHQKDVPISKGLTLMTLRTLAIGAVAATLLFAVPQIAHAAWGVATGNVNMRTCPSTQCLRITVVPVGARVWIAGKRGGWYLVNYARRRGYVSGRFIAAAVLPPRYLRPYFLPPRSGYVRRPWWDSRYGAWYDGDRWYFQGRWYDGPNGFYFGFRIGD